MRPSNVRTPARSDRARSPAATTRGQAHRAAFSSTSRTAGLERLAAGQRPDRPEERDQRLAERLARPPSRSASPIPRSMADLPKTPVPIVSGSEA